MKTYRNILITAVFLISAAAFLGSCNLGTGGGSVAGGTAKVTINVPGVSSLLSQAFAAGSKGLSGEGSRALLFATHAQIIVLDGASNEVYNSYMVPVSNPNPGTQVSVSCSLPPGIEYTATADVWNENQSAVSILHGETTFTPVSGTNQIKITLTPVDAQVITDFVNPTTYDVVSSVYTGGAFTYRGGEKWYGFSAQSEIMQFTITPDFTTTTIYAGLYDSKGDLLASSLSPSFTGAGTDNFVSFQKGLTFGEYYYLGFIEVDNAATAPCTGTVLVFDPAVAYEQDAEPNDTMATAQWYYGGEPIAGFAADADWFAFVAPADGPSCVWFNFFQPTWGSVRVYDYNGMEIGQLNVDGLTGQELFAVDVDFTVGNTYYARGDFYVKDPNYMLRSMADYYNFGAGIPPPSSYMSPNIEYSTVDNVMRGQLVVNEANPSSMAYIWLSSADWNLHSMSSMDGGKTWDLPTNLSYTEYAPLDFAADMDENGNMVVLYTEVDDLGLYAGSIATAYYGSRNVASTTWANYAVPIWGTYNAMGAPDVVEFPSVARSASNLIFGFGYDNVTDGMGANGTGAYMGTWSSGIMGSFTDLGIGGGGVDNPWNHQVAGDTSGYSYYLYTDNRIDWESGDIFIKEGGSDYVLADLPGGNDAAQPFLIQRTSDFLLLYTVYNVGAGTNELRARAASSPSLLASAAEYTLTSGVLRNFPYPDTTPFRTYFAQIDSKGIVHVVYQGADSSIYSFTIEGNSYQSAASPTYLSWATLDGIALNTEHGEAVLYVSSHDSFGYGYVDRVSNSPRIPN